LCSVDLFGANLRAQAITDIIRKACEFSDVRDFCFEVLGDDPLANLARNKFHLEDIAIELATTNYSYIHRRVWTITFSETNPDLKHIYRSCLHEYNVMKTDFRNFIPALVFNGDLESVALDASYHVNTCEYYFIRSPNISNPFAQDNDNMFKFLDLIRGIYLAPLGS
ncbi:hypothetical protein T459_23023, partial [Capsicum annuum]